jgi:sulfate permease, SulP family
MFALILETLLLVVLLLTTTTTAVVSTITTTTIGAMYGIYTGVGLALLYVLVRASTSKTVVLGRLPGTTVYRNVERFSEARETPGIKIVRQDGSLNFACYEAFVATLDRLATKDIHTIIVDTSSINSIDSSSMKGLLKLVDVSTCSHKHCIINTAS